MSPDGAKQKPKPKPQSPKIRRELLDSRAKKLLLSDEEFEEVWNRYRVQGVQTCCGCGSRSFSPDSPCVSCDDPKLRIPTCGMEHALCERCVFQMVHSISPFIGRGSSSVLLACKKSSVHGGLCNGTMRVRIRKS